MLLLIGLLILVIVRPWRAGPDEARAWPQVIPTPQDMTVLGSDPMMIKDAVTVVVTPDTDQPALQLLRATLEARGLSVDEQTIGDRVTGDAVVLGGLTGLGSQLEGSDLQLETFDRPEGYALDSSAADRIVIGGVDGAGQYYGVRTLAQLLGSSAGAVTVPRTEIIDYPELPLRGSIEGFYGQPWSQAERLDQLAFYGSVRMNTYIYAPKDDPYHRGRWRDPYPAEQLGDLRELTTRAAENHVNLTFALSPGQSICFSDSADRDRLLAKLQAVYDIGVRSFSIPLDDIDYGTWHCDGDKRAYDQVGGAGAGQAQAELLNFVQREFIETHDGTRPLQMVPTEYSSVGESGYKSSLRTELDPAVVIMWTGVGVIPESITAQDARQAAKVWGRKVFIWDNYPVNDFPRSSGRLLLAPYAKRDKELPAFSQGIVANPMNQSAASKIALTGVADFSWNPKSYDAERTWQWEVNRLAGGDEQTRDALLVFADLNRLAPTQTGQWQPQAPRLQQLSDQLAADPEHADLAALRRYADLMVAGPDLIEENVDDVIFLTDCADWLTAMRTWGQALQAGLDAAEAKRSGDTAAVAALSAKAGELMVEARSIEVSDERNAWSEDGPVPVRLGDGVLDSLIMKISRQ